MTTSMLLALGGDRLISDVVWFLLLCAIFAFFRFHRWRKNRVTRKTEAIATEKKAA